MSSPVIDIFDVTSAACLCYGTPHLFLAYPLSFDFPMNKRLRFRK
jgi:hypothetical protein